jgi:hypothetical protein
MHGNYCSALFCSVYCRHADVCIRTY